ncbi:hypothetical protein DP145_02580 [Clostridium tetani]|nr:hypothetical protein LA33_10950 [Clostridium tetani ATCC 9441]RXI47854.1 hypothetical protein DP126_00915 [Clostridium tetani]RXM61068.1 hypothetical protein DP138_05510 [Clostridium tetani]RXM69595.1 hypothetical protein DP145_02580 [Clostridium tetani]
MNNEQLWIFFSPLSLQKNFNFIKIAMFSEANEPWKKSKIFCSKAEENPPKLFIIHKIKKVLHTFFIL